MEMSKVRCPMSLRGSVVSERNKWFFDSFCVAGTRVSGSVPVRGFDLAVCQMGSGLSDSHVKWGQV
jgi:hypothetical protein